MCLIIKLHPQGCLVIQGSLPVMPPAPTRPGTIFQFLQLKGCFPDSKSLRLKMEIFCWRKDLHFWLGNMKSHSLHFSCPPIRWVTVVLKWWPKESQLFWEPSLQLPLMPLWGKLIRLAILSNFKIMCTWGLEVCAYGCKCPRRSSWLLKKKF